MVTTNVMTKRTPSYRSTVREYLKKKYGFFATVSFVVVVLLVLTYVVTGDLNFLLTWRTTFDYVAYFLISAFLYLTIYGKERKKHLGIYFDALLMALYIFYGWIGGFPLLFGIAMIFSGWYGFIFSFGVIAQGVMVVIYQVTRDKIYLKKLYKEPEVDQRGNKLFKKQNLALILMNVFYLSTYLIYFLISSGNAQTFDSVATLLVGMSSLCYLVYFLVHPGPSVKKERTLFHDPIVSREVEREFLARIMTSLLVVFFVYCQLVSLYPYIDFFRH